MSTSSIPQPGPGVIGGVPRPGGGGGGGGGGGEWTAGDVSAVGPGLEISGTTLQITPATNTPQSSNVPAGSAVVLTNNVAADITHITLQPGTWLVYGNVGLFAAGGAGYDGLGWISSVSATQPTAPNSGAMFADSPAGVNQSNLYPVGAQIITVVAPTVIYLSAEGTFGGGSLSAYGFLGALPVEQTLVSSGGFNVPTAASFSWLNQIGGTLADNANGPLVLENATGAGGDDVCWTHTPVPGAGNWTYTVRFRTMQAIGANQPQPSIGVDDGTKIITFCNNSNFMNVSSWNSHNSNAGQLAGVGGCAGNDFWMRILYNPTTPSLTFQFSPDGVTWATIYQETGTLFLTPTHFGMGGDMRNVTTQIPLIMSFVSLVQT